MDGRRWSSTRAGNAAWIGLHDRVSPRAPEPCAGLRPSVLSQIRRRGRQGFGMAKDTPHVVQSLFQFELPERDPPLLSWADIPETTQRELIERLAELIARSAGVSNLEDGDNH